MSKDDNEDGGGSLLRFPRILMPGSLDAPDSRPAAGDEPPPVGSWPRLPGVEEMAPPLALTMPGIPDATDDVGDDEGAFVLPQSEDPANPTARDMLAVAMALVTAMGVAAAQGMWHRARRRSALADQARANADKATHKAAGAGHHTSGQSGSRHESGHRRRSHGPSAGGHGGSGPSGRGPGRRKKRSEKDHDNSHSGSHKRRKNRRKAPKSTPDGRTASDSTKRGKRRKAKGGPGDGACVQTRKPRKSDAKGKSKGKDAKGTSTPSTPKPRRTMTWKAPHKSRPGPGGDKALPPGRKRWTRPAPTADGKSTPSPRPARGKSKRKRTWTSTPAWVKRWRSRRKATSTSSAGSAGSQQAGDQQSQTRPTPPPPGFEGMRPPPGTDRTVRVTVQRADERPRASHESWAHTGAPAPVRAALPPSPAGASSPPSSASSSTPVPTRPNGARFVSVPRVPSTQYRDAEVTVYDVIEADADMAEEILVGVDEARATVDGCEVLLTRLEAVHAKIVELKVPGLLAGWLVRLMEKTGTVKGSAQAIADRLPAASEAIAVAGGNAAAIYQPPADVTRDMGHTRPAEREYHNE